MIPEDSIQSLPPVRKTWREGGGMSVRSGLLMWAALLAPLQTATAQAIPDSTMVVHFIDVGQGAAALLEFSCGTIMIDAGGQAASDVERLTQYLGRFFDRRSDLDSTIASIIVSHNHIDHTRGLRRVIEQFNVLAVVEHGMRGGPRDQGDAALRWLTSEVSAGRFAGAFVDVDDGHIMSDAGLVTPEIDPIDCGGTDPAVTLLSADIETNPGWPKRDFTDKNNHSLVVRIDFGEASFLFTGDLERPAIGTLMEFYEGTPMLQADVYHVGHHGSHNATSWALLEVMRPAIAVMSAGSCTRDAGQFNAFRFGHPRAATVDSIQAIVQRRRASPKRVMVADGVEDFRRITMRDAIYATGWDGTVTVQATASGAYVVRVENQTAPTGC